MSETTDSAAPLVARLRDLAESLNDAIAACKPFTFTLTPILDGEFTVLDEKQATVWHAYQALTAACHPDAILTLCTALETAQHGEGDTVRDFAEFLATYGTVVQREKLPSIAEEYLRRRAIQASRFKPARRAAPTTERDHA